MVDFHGQNSIFKISACLLIIAIPVAIAYGFIVDNYLKGMNVIIYVSAAIMIAFVPNWPWLNRNPPPWSSDEELKNDKNKKAKQENQTKGLRRRK